MRPPAALAFHDDEEPAALLEIANGNNALVLSIAGRFDAVLKWYRQELTAGKRRRLRDALAVGQDPAVALRHPGVCWPIGTVNAADGRMAGCLMRRATPGSVELAWLSTVDGRREKRLPDAPAARVDAARDVAGIVAGLHEDHWIVGDLRRGNVMVNLRPGRRRSVEMVDSDSFWRADVARRGLGGRTQYADGCAAPEILRDGRPPSELTDRWALAVLVFQVLNEARHPLGRPGGGPTLDAVVIAAPPSPGAFDGFPDPLDRLFRRAFATGYDAPELRQTAEEWCVGLNALR
jgi:DNA-binding helix-hairpin-helix protein with protein kinase domain